MSTRRFCDVCGSEFGPDQVNHGTGALPLTGVNSVRQRDEQFRRWDVAVEVKTVKREGKNTPVDLCVGCLIDAVKALDPRPVNAMGDE